MTMMIHINMTAVFALVWLLWYLYTLQKRWVPKIKEAIYAIWRDNGVETNDDDEDEAREEENGGKKWRRLIRFPFFQLALFVYCLFLCLSFLNVLILWA